SDWIQRERPTATRAIVQNACLGMRHFVESVVFVVFLPRSLRLFPGWHGRIYFTPNPQFSVSVFCPRLIDELSVTVAILGEFVWVTPLPRIVSFCLFWINPEELLLFHVIIPMLLH